MSHYVRGLLLGMALAVALFTACGNIDTPPPVTPQCAKPPHCPPDVVSNPQPVYPATEVKQ